MRASIRDCSTSGARPTTSQLVRSLSFCQDRDRVLTFQSPAMIFLHDNVFLERDLTFDDIKPRLLGNRPIGAGIVATADTLIGHWGTCPGLTLVYSHLNLLVTKHDFNLLYVVGPGHGAPAILASLWIEGSLEKVYPQYGRTRQGLHNLITKFSTPSGFPRYPLIQVCCEGRSKFSIVT